jgi:hypothetical protein
MNAKEQAKKDFEKLYGTAFRQYDYFLDYKYIMTGKSQEDYWEKLTRMSHDMNCRIYRTDHISRHETVYNVLVFNRAEPFLQVRAKTLNFMEFVR